MLRIFGRHVLVVGFVGLPLVATAILSLGSGSIDSAVSASPLLAAPTPRTVTDERQLRIVAVAVAGPEIAAGATPPTRPGGLYPNLRFLA